jgi:hypothetical protein
MSALFDDLKEIMRITPCAPCARCGESEYLNVDGLCVICEHRDVDKRMTV